MVPNFLYYTGCDTVKDLDGFTLLENWFRYRQDEPVPSYFKRPEWQKKFDSTTGDLPITLYIKHANKPIPQELKFDGWVDAFE